jgi:DNA repair protein RadD
VTFQLRPNQVAAANAVEDAFRAGVNRPLVDSCVGSGKSLTMAELARREITRGGRIIIGAHTRELVEQNADACAQLGLQVGINAAALNQRTWRAPVISAAIQSIYRNAASFGPISLFLGDEAHLWPHSEAGMYRGLVRDLGVQRAAGFSGTVFRLQGGSLVEGEGAPFERVVYRYSILDGIRDGYLVPAFSAPADDKIDPSRLKTQQGEYTADSQDAQMLALMDNHIAQMVHHGRDRRAWLVFEASTKAAHAMCKRLNEWGIPTGLVLGETPAGERAATIAAYRSGRLRCLVNVAALTTGFDVQEVDLLVMRRRTKSLGLYIQMVGRLLRTIGGNIERSIAAGKSDGLVLDFAGNIDQHGPLDFLRPKDIAARLTSCETCNARNPAAALRCWSCDEPMTKLCPACLESIRKGTLDCPHCGHDMRAGPRDEAAGGATKGLLDKPSGAALIAAYKTGVERQGGWLPILRVFGREDETVEVIVGGVDMTRHAVTGALATHVRAARWLRLDDATKDVAAVLVPNGAARTSVLQITRDGVSLIVPMPSQTEAA